MEEEDGWRKSSRTKNGEGKKDGEGEDLEARGGGREQKNGVTSQSPTKERRLASPAP